jgi:hypothetical protein
MPILSLGSHGMQAWMQGQTPCILRCLPLVFHPSTMVRRAIAFFLAPLVFLPTAERMSPCTVQARTPQAAIPLFPIFHRHYHMPLPVAQVPLHVHRHGDKTLVRTSVDWEACGTANDLLDKEKHQQTQMVFRLLSVGKLVRQGHGHPGYSGTTAVQHSSAAHADAISTCLTQLQELQGVCCRAVNETKSFATFVATAPKPEERVQVICTSQTSMRSASGGCCQKISFQNASPCSGQKLKPVVIMQECRCYFFACPVGMLQQPVKQKVPLKRSQKF